jgi:predicted nucleic acid-binding protein
LKADLRKNGTPVDDFDLLIGATALTLGYCVVTNNERHFSKIPGLDVVNWAR